MAARPVALVTGASAGLGEAFARRLAARGHDLVVVARRRGSLERLALELGQAYGTDTEVLVCDLEDPAGLAAVVARLRDGGEVDTVVNNAGYGTYGRFWELPPDGELGEVRLNVAAVVALSHAALARMVPRGAGRLLNVSSTAGFTPGPGSATYAATKAFVTSFTEALHAEVAGTGVHVTALCPGFTRTDFQARANVATGRLPRFVWAEAGPVVDAGLEALAANRALCVPGWVNKVVAFAPRLSPRAAVRATARQVTGRLLPGPHGG